VSVGFSGAAPAISPAGGRRQIVNAIAPAEKRMGCGSSMNAPDHSAGRPARRRTAHEACLTFRRQRMPGEFQVLEFVRGAPCALRFPERLAERLDENVLGRMQVPAPRAKFAMQFPYPGWPVDGHLLAHCKVQAEMQVRIGRALCLILSGRGFSWRGRDDRVIFRV
jgi:hypothetical protein